MLVEQSVLDFLNEVDSNSAAPGGGSVSSLVGAMGVALARMYGHLSIGKKKYMLLDEEVRLEFENCFEQLTYYKDALADGVDLDTCAYQKVIEACRLPKDSDEEKVIRQSAIDSAMEGAILSPYRMMEHALAAMKLCLQLLPYGNKNALSDMGCAILCLDMAIHGAYLNVRINLSNDEQVAKWLDKIDAMLSESESIKEKAFKEIKGQL